MIFSKCEWNQDAETALRPLIDPANAADFQENIDTGRATLWKVRGDGCEAWLVTRAERYKSGHLEVVLEVIQGNKARAVVNELKRRLKAVGVQSLRFETHHPEAVAARLMRGTGFERTATVFKVAL